MSTTVEDLEAVVLIVATVHPPETLFLRTEVGEGGTEGTGGGHPIELSLNADMKPLIRVPDGRWVCFSWQALVASALEAVQEIDQR